MNIYNPFPVPLFDNNGTLATRARAFFYAAGTTTPLTVYQNAALTTAHTWPVVAGNNGVLPPIYVPYVDYKVHVTTAAGGTIFEVDNIKNPDPAADTGGGGGGGDIDENALFTTGDIMFRFKGGTRPGWVRANGRTIGASASSATERADADCQLLFVHLWDSLPDSIATVSSGRGGSATADWLANKTIIVPSFQGRSPIGLDDMGSSSAGVSQVSTTINVTNGSNSATVASATGIARYNHVMIDGVYAGYVSAISGTTITLSTNYTGTTGSGKAARFSPVIDIQQPGSIGGLSTVELTTRELPAHTHGVTDPGHNHTITGTLLSSGSGVAGGPSLLSSPATLASATTGITINSAGDGGVFNLVHPVRAVTYYMKL